MNDGEHEELCIVIIKLFFVIHTFVIIELCVMIKLFAIINLVVMIKRVVKIKLFVVIKLFLMIKLFVIIKLFVTIKLFVVIKLVFCNTETGLIIKLMCLFARLRTNKNILFGKQIVYRHDKTLGEIYQKLESFVFSILFDSLRFNHHNEMILLLLE